MTFKEAYESGKEFKRKNQGIWESSRDLVSISLMDALATDWETKPEKKTYKCWVNFYKDSDSVAHASKDRADFYAADNRIGEAVEVTMEVGE